MKDAIERAPHILHRVYPALIEHRTIAQQLSIGGSVRVNVTGLLQLFLLLLVPFASAQTTQDIPEAAVERVRLGLLRGVPEKWGLEKNFSVFLQQVEQADAQGAEIFITPECWLDGYAAADSASTRERLQGVAQALKTSPWLQRVSQEAREREMMICFGFTSLEGERVYNAAGLWNQQGELTGLYRKTHLQDHDLQFDYGTGLPVWQTPWGPVGIMICADRRWPETARALRLQGARLILNPTYGFFGEMNLAMMRTRSYENQCFIAFTHPEEGLVTGPKGKVMAQESAAGPGVLVCDVDLAQAKNDGHLADRRPELYGGLSQGGSAATAPAVREGPVLRAAAAQMASTFDVSQNAAKIVALLESADLQEVRVVVFPELALTGYSKDATYLERLDWTLVEEGLARIKASCDRLDIYAIVGAPTREGDAVYCSAVAIGPDGNVLDIYEKTYLAGEAWAQPGRKLTSFMVDGIRCASFVCHDERYGPLVQLRALAGAQVFFYVSCESGVDEMHKLNAYRAQVQGRAQENRVFIVHANTPAATDKSGLADVSHGESRIVDPDGNLLAEAPVYGDQLLVTDLRISMANTHGREAALTSGPLAEWMRQGVALVENK